MQLDPLSEATRRVAHAQVELEAKGYPPSLVIAGLSRAQGTAYYKVQDIEDQITRERAFLDIVTKEIQRTESWLIREKRFADGLSDTSEPEEEGGE